MDIEVNLKVRQKHFRIHFIIFLSILGTFIKYYKISQLIHTQSIMN